jgi:hypothetical protein
LDEGLLHLSPVDVKLQISLGLIRSPQLVVRIA